jgi:hypothetical protein
MANGWTPERRAKQAALIREWKPWEQSTGPRSVEGKALTARNGYKGGHWRELRKLSKTVNALLRDQRDQLKTTMD